MQLQVSQKMEIFLLLHFTSLLLPGKPSLYHQVMGNQSKVRNRRHNGRCIHNTSMWVPPVNALYCPSSKLRCGKRFNDTLSLYLVTAACLRALELVYLIELFWSEMATNLCWKLVQSATFISVDQSEEIWYPHSANGLLWLCTLRAAAVRREAPPWKGRLAN